MTHRHLAALLAATGLGLSTGAFAAVDMFNFADPPGGQVQLGQDNGRIVQRMADGSVRPAKDGKYKGANGQFLEVRGGMQVGSFSWGSLPGSARAQDFHFKGGGGNPGQAQGIILQNPGQSKGAAVGFNPQPEPPGDKQLQKGAPASK